jgi:toxin ParE1/3/4
LITQAYADLSKHPGRSGTQRLPGLLKGFWLYPIRHSLTHLAPERRLQTARHIIAFRYDDKRVEIARLLHDSMDIPSRLK